MQRVLNRWCSRRCIRISSRIWFYKQYYNEIAREFKVIASEDNQNTDETKLLSTVNNLNLSYNNKYYLLSGSDENNKDYLAIVIEMRNTIILENLTEELSDNNISRIEGFFNEIKKSIISHENY